MFFTLRKVIYPVIAFLCGVAVLTACGTSGTPAANNAPTMAANAALNAGVVFEHSPAGAAELAWNPTNHALTVKISLLGLSPNSKHPAHIHAGSCAKDGSVIYPLEEVTTNETGIGTSTSIINNVTGGIPATGWYINVHNGPGLSVGAQATSISCGNIINRSPGSTTAQNVRVQLGASASPNQAVRGSAQLKLSGGALTVVLSLQGLESKTTHAAHIHEGGCGNQGKALYMLKPVVANATGQGTSTTVINGVSSVPDASWYMNVYQAADMAATQTDGDIIACGDVLTGR